METSKTIEDIKVALQKLAAETSPPQGGAMGHQSGASTPQDVMDLIDQAIDILENAQGGIPAQKGGVEAAPAGGQPPMAQTASQKLAAEAAPESVTPGEGLTDEKKKSIQKSEPRVSGSGEGEKPSPDQLIARIAALEGELEKKKKEEVGMEYAKLFPEEQQQGKLDEILASKDSIEVITAKYLAAKEVAESTVKQAQQTPNHNTYTKLGGFRKASLDSNRTPEWRF